MYLCTYICAYINIYIYHICEHTHISENLPAQKNVV